MTQNEKKKMSESKVLVELVNATGAVRGMEIYYKFIFDYKSKHIGDFDGTKKYSWEPWYDKRAETFYRFVHINYIKGK